MHVNIKKTKVMTTEKIPNFNVGDKDTEIVRFFLPSSSHQFKWRLQLQEKATTQKRSCGRIRKVHQEQRCVIRAQG